MSNNKNSESIIQDPVNGPIKINGIFKEIVDSHYFQRLRNIKQLGLCNLVYPGANHTRFEHSLGTMYMAKQLSNVLNIDDDKPLLGALLHDIGHMPFSHSIEDVFYKYYKVTHEDLTKKIIMGEGIFNDSDIPEIIEKYGYNPKDIAGIATGKSKKYRLYSSMVSGPIDVDEIDYLRRDAFYCGVTMGHIDHMRLFNTVTINNNNIVGEEKSIPTLESTLITRILMFNSVYFHKTCRVAQKMLGIAYELYKDKSIDDLKLFDYSFLEKLNSGNTEIIVNNILNRKLFKVIWREKYTPENYNIIKERMSRFNDDQYIIDIIPPLYFAGKERIKNYFSVYYRGEIKRIDNVSSLARSLYREVDRRNIIVSVGPQIKDISF